MDEFLKPSSIIDSDHPEIVKLANELQTAEAIYNFVRDEISHSLDIGAQEVTTTASEVLEKGHGFCYAKSHLLAALLRAANIPAAMLYQRLYDDESGTYFLHGLNAIYTDSGWIIVDARGNKPGIDAEFNKKLAYPTRQELGEILYEQKFAAPSEVIVTALQQSLDCAYLRANLPKELS